MVVFYKVTKVNNIVLTVSFVTVIMNLQLRKLTRLQTVYIGSAKRCFHLAEDEYKLIIVMLNVKYGVLTFGIEKTLIPHYKRCVVCTTLLTPPPSYDERRMRQGRNIEKSVNNSIVKSIISNNFFIVHHPLVSNLCQQRMSRAYSNEATYFEMLLTFSQIV